MYADKASKEGLCRQLVQDMQRSMQGAVQSGMQSHAETVTAAVSGIKRKVTESTEQMAQRIDAYHAEGLKRVKDKHDTVVERLSSIQNCQTEIADNVCRFTDGQTGRRASMTGSRSWASARSQSVPPPHAWKENVPASTARCRNWPTATLPHKPS